MVKAGVQRLTEMQLSDGGWGWFSGWGERSYPHTTATVVHGLQLAKQNDVALPPGMLERGSGSILGAYGNARPVAFGDTLRVYHGIAVRQHGAEPLGG